MGRIYVIMGKSASGKDSLAKEILKRIPELKPIVLYTTRPIREGEKADVDYHFVDDACLDAYTEQGKVIELRTYSTIHGVWKYATIDDGQMDLASSDYLMIGTLESYKKMTECYGTAALVPLYIEVEDGERLTRALEREKKQKTPKYAELCRRFLADEKDFSEKNLEELEIRRRFVNRDMEDCLKELTGVIKNGRI